MMVLFGLEVSVYSPLSITTTTALKTAISIDPTGQK